MPATKQRRKRLSTRATCASRLLDAFKEGVGTWVCSHHNSNSQQSAATFREIKNLGYSFEQAKMGKWAKKMHCETCGTVRSHYKLLDAEPAFDQRGRVPITPAQRQRIIGILEGRDAFTDATIQSTPTIDHKVPWTRLETDVDPADLTDEEIPENYQLLTNEHNLLKDRSCTTCRTTGKRPPFLAVGFWYEGDSEYRGTCRGCGWFDPQVWRDALHGAIHKVPKV